MVQHRPHLGPGAGRGRLRLAYRQGAGLDLEQLGEQLRWHLGQVRSLTGQAWEHRFAIGARLHAAKMLLPKGELYAWAKREVNLAERQARKYLWVSQKRQTSAEFVTADPDIGLDALVAKLREAERGDQEQAPLARPVSVVETDQEALAALLAIHAPAGPRILDVTYGRGRIWRGLPYQPHRLDRDRELHEAGFTDTVADFRDLPFAAASWDVVVFDPPHLTDAGDGIAGGTEYGELYGTNGHDLKGASSAPLFEPFLREARRVLAPATGVVLGKIADQVHAGAYQWQHLDLILAAQALGMTACDVVIRVALARKGLVDPRWKRVAHVRGVHSYWLVLRNGSSCMNPRSGERE